MLISLANMREPIMIRHFIVIASLAVALTPARADRAAGDACAASLSAPSQQIYHCTLAAKPTPDTAKQIVTAQTEKLMQEGKLSMFSARSAAQAAGKCLQLVMR